MIGLDGMMHPMFKRLVGEGVLPNLRRLEAEGVVAESYSSLPAWTPTNRATLITGAHTGTHSASRWLLNIPSPRRTARTLSTFVGNALSAETVFEAAAKADFGWHAYREAYKAADRVIATFWKATRCGLRSEPHRVAKYGGA